MRKISIIDIGSNTIRLVTFSIIDNNRSVILNERFFAGIIEHTQSGELSDEGMEIIINCLTKLKALSNLIRADELHCFATASLRYIDNIAAVKQQVLQQVGLDIEILSGDDEILYDYAALKSNGVPDNGIGLDLGGGSGQLFRFESGEIQNALSLPIGTLLLYNRHVTGVLPTKEEQKAIRQDVKAQLHAHAGLSKLDHDTIYCMGGGVRAALKLYRALQGPLQVPGKADLTKGEIKDMLHAIYDMGDKGVRLVSHVIPERLYTVIPAMLTLKEILKYTGAERLQVVKSSVREGYLCQKILKQSSISIGS